MYVIGEFREKEAAVEAIWSLRRAGIGAADVDLFSEEPIDLPRGVLDRPSRMSLVSVAGAIGFGGLATAFIWFSQHHYRIVTGGMPLFSFWATGVVTYEMTMLGAIVATFVWFLKESGLARKRGRRAPAPIASPGSMCLRVRCRAEQAAQVSETLRRERAIGVDRKDDGE